MDIKILIVFLILSISIFLVFLLYSSTHPKIQFLTNTTELYSSFTPYMQQWVNSRLNSIDCKPDKYYFNDSQICFACKELNVCFGYVYVQREGGEKINPYGYPFLIGKYDENVAVNFYSLGLSNSLNCEKGIEKKWICNNEIELTFENNTVTLMFPQGSNLYQEIERISMENGLECEFINNIYIFFNCKVMSFLPIGENKVEVG